MVRRSEKYTGALLSERPPARWPNETFDEHFERYINYCNLRYSDLFRFFKIDEADPQRWMFLAIELADRHVPSFQEPKAIGRKPEPFQRVRDIWLLIKLREVDRAGKSVANAADYLRRKHPYFQRSSAGSLRSRYYALLSPTTQEGSNLRREFPNVDDILSGAAVPDGGFEDPMQAMLFAQFDPSTADEKWRAIRPILKAHKASARRDRGDHRE